MILSVLLCGAFLDWYLKLKSVYSLNQAGDPKPEYCLPPMLFGTRHILIPIGIISFGWSS